LSVTPERGLREAAERVFGLNDLRPEQLQAMAAIADGRDVLGRVSHTGAGFEAMLSG
jgi:hypothetical protein